MSTLAGTDAFVVSRAGVNYKVTAANLMSTVLDTDLFVVNRGSVNYKVTGLDAKAYFVGPSPSTGDVVIGGGWVYIGYDSANNTYWSWNQVGGGNVGGTVFSSSPVYVSSSLNPEEWTLNPPMASAISGSEYALTVAGNLSLFGFSGDVFGKGYKFDTLGNRTNVGWVLDYGASLDILYAGTFSTDYSTNRTLVHIPTRNDGGQALICGLSTDAFQTNFTSNNFGAVFPTSATNYTELTVNQFLPGANRWLLGGFLGMGYTVTGSGASVVASTVAPYSNIWPGTLAGPVAENADGSIIIVKGRVNNGGVQLGDYLRSTDLGASFSPQTPAGFKSITSGPWFINGKFRYFNVAGAVISLESSTDGLTWTSQDVSASFTNFTPGTPTLNSTSNSAYDGTDLYVAGSFSSPSTTGIAFVSGSLFT